MKEESKEWKQIDNRGEKVRQLVVAGDNLIALWEDGQIWYKLYDTTAPKKELEKAKRHIACGDSVYNSDLTNLRRNDEKRIH